MLFDRVSENSKWIAMRVCERKGLLSLVWRIVVDGIGRQTELRRHSVNL